VLRQTRPPLGLQLALASKAVSRAFNDALAEAGGSLPVWLILTTLRDGACGAQREIAETIGIQGSTLTIHLDKLERAGLVVRARDPRNRRNSQVELTSAGRAAHGRLLQAVVAFNQRLRSGLSSDEVAQLSALLTRLRTNVSQETLPSVSGSPSRPGGRAHAAAASR
jgi:MarR family transcriptional regulator for hemolysin